MRGVVSDDEQALRVAVAHVFPGVPHQTCQSHSIENVDTAPIEALQSTGASRLQLVRYGIMPQVLPHLVSYTLYRWEVNIRAAAILGFVGVGGLGQRIHIALNLFWEQQLPTYLISLYLLVTAVDALSAFLRRKTL